MVPTKAPEEIAAMRAAGRIVAACHKALARRIRPGVSTGELDAFAEAYLRQFGASPSFKGYKGFPAAICVAPNDVVCHGIPGPHRLADGDVVTIDVGAYHDGFHADRAWTYAVGTPAPEVARLMALGRQGLLRGVAQARPGNRLGDVAHAIQAFAERNGLGVVRDFTGHGIGRRLHEPPDVPHAGEPGTGLRLEAGMTLCIEPMLTLGDWRVRLDADGWTARTVDGSPAVQYEHTVAVTDAGPLVLTR